MHSVVFHSCMTAAMLPGRQPLDYESLRASQSQGVLLKQCKSTQQCTVKRTRVLQVAGSLVPGRASPALLQAAQHQAIRHRPRKVRPVSQRAAIPGPQPVQACWAAC